MEGNWLKKQKKEILIRIILELLEDLDSLDAIIKKIRETNKIMTKKQEALKWYLEGAKDADETSNTNHIVKDFETHFQLKYKRSLGEKIESDFKKFQSGESFYKNFYELKNPPTYMDKEIITLLDSYRFFLLENLIS